MPANSQSPATTTFPRSRTSVPNVFGTCQARTPRPRIGLSPRAARRHLAQFDCGERTA